MDATVKDGERPTEGPFTISEMQEFLGVEADCIVGRETIEAWEKYSCQVEFERAMKGMAK